jgi:hypothetical protein
MSTLSRKKAKAVSLGLPCLANLERHKAHCWTLLGLRHSFWYRLFTINHDFMSSLNSSLTITNKVSNHLMNLLSNKLEFLQEETSFQRALKILKLCLLLGLSKRWLSGLYKSICRKSQRRWPSQILLNEILQICRTRVCRVYSTTRIW